MLGGLGAISSVTVLEVHPRLEVELEAQFLVYPGQHCFVFREDEFDSRRHFNS